MEVVQVYNLVNNATKQAIGETAVLNEDLSNIIDIGTSVFNANAVDNYVRSLINHIGKVIFVNRPYAGNIPSILRDGWEFGSVLEKVSMEIPQATENESWELQDGEVYEENIFTKPIVTAQFFNKKITFEVPISLTERQVKESFSNAAQLNAFVSMVYNAVDTSMTIKTDEVTRRLINNMIAETVRDDFGAVGIDTMTGVKAVNLLYKYNQHFGRNLTAAQALTDADFVRYASYTIGMYADRLATASTLFNIGGKLRHTPRDRNSIVLLSEFKRAAGVYLYDANGQLRDDNIRLPESETVAYWQGSGLDYEFASTGAINVKDTTGDTVQVTGILGVMFDRDGLMICNEDRRTTTKWNAKAEFWNNWYKWDVSLYSDTNENFVVFFVA